MTPRSTKQGPFCWQSKAVRRSIRERFDARNCVATALSLYDALTEEASNKQAETFTTTHAWLHVLSGVSPSTIKKHLKVFADMGIVKIKECPGLRGPSTYTLLANGCLTLANGTPNGALATSEESSEESKEESPEQIPAPAKPAAEGGDAPPLGADSEPEAITAATIFAAYPKRTKKKPALKAIASVLKVENPARILAATKAYADAVALWPDADRRFVPAPANWFSDGCYDDDPEMWKRGGAASLDPDFNWDDPAAMKRHAERTKRANYVSPVIDGPPGWRETLAEAYPGNLVLKENGPWSSVPEEKKRELFSGWSFDSKLNKWRPEKGVTMV